MASLLPVSAIRVFALLLSAALVAACGERPKLERLSSEAVVLAFGDSLTFGNEQAERNVRAMVKLAKSRGVGVLLIGTPEPGFTVSPPAFYAGIAKEFRLPYEGGIIGQVLKDSTLKADPIHPNARGYRVIAERIAETLKKGGAI
jgi:lysophospholipase L1-like esterase